jgi:hypothetical protein
MPLHAELSEQRHRASLAIVDNDSSRIGEPLRFPRLSRIECRA